jgi:hypothetical protein
MFALAAYLISSRALEPADLSRLSIPAKYGLIRSLESRPGEFGISTLGELIKDDNDALADAANKVYSHRLKELIDALLVNWTTPARVRSLNACERI